MFIPTSTVIREMIVQKETDTEIEKKNLLSTLLANFSTPLVYFHPRVVEIKPTLLDTTI